MGLYPFVKTDHSLQLRGVEGAELLWFETTLERSASEAGHHLAKVP